MSGQDRGRPDGGRPAFESEPASDPLPAGVPHGRLEDGYALFVGCALIILGLTLLQAAGLVTGGIAGVALLAAYFVPLPVGVLFTLINIPFFVFAGVVMGRRFMLRTVLVSMSIAVLSVLTRYAFSVGMIHPLYAALVGGTTIGMGILALARHGAGVGGTGVVTLWLYRTRGWNAGITQMAFDTVILAVSATVTDGPRLAASAVSAAAISGMMLAWHRPGRYTGY